MDDGQVWMWRYTPPMFSFGESVLGGLIGLVIGFILAWTFDSGNTELIRSQSGWDGWRFVAIWVSLVPLAGILLITLTKDLTAIWRGAPIDYGKLFMGEVLFGAGIAITQWLILRAWHYTFPGWILMTTLGWSLGFVASTFGAQYFGAFFEPGFGLIFISPIVTASIGQCFCLRQSLLRSVFWIVANAGAAIFSRTILQEYRSYMPSNIDSYIMWVLIGLALALLLRKPRMKNLPVLTTS